MAHPVVHFEIMAKDGARLAEFYRNAFGWQVDGVPAGPPYWLVKKEAEGIGGGIGSSQDGRATLTVYVQVKDCAEVLEKLAV